MKNKLSVYNFRVVDWQKLISITLNLFTKDIKTRYANSVLGFGWMILNPLFFVSIISLVFSLVFQSTGYNTPYFIFVLIGYIHWLFFSQSISHIITSLISYRNIIVNAYFPRLAIPLSVLFSKALDFLILLVITFSLLFFVSGINVVKFLPIYLWLLSIQVSLQFGVGLIFATMNVYLRDVQYSINIGLQLLFYATPVVYSVSIVPERFHELIKLNPIAFLLIQYRDLFFLGTYQFNMTVVMTVVSLLTLLIGMIVFLRNQKKVAEFL